MNQRFEKVLSDQNVKIVAKGNKDLRIPKRIAEDPELQRALTKHGAHLVMSASNKGERLSYKAIGAMLYAEAERMVGEAEMRARKEIDLWRERAITLEVKLAGIEAAANGHESEKQEETVDATPEPETQVEDTAGN